MSSPEDVDFHTPPLREVIEAHGLSAQKKLGQNFLLDPNITDKIVRNAHLPADTTVFEIGPGPGGLTRSLLKGGVSKVMAIEFDERAVAALQDLKARAGERLEIIRGDALEIDLLSLSDPPRAIVANLPYNIATPLLIRWLRDIREETRAYSSMTLMFQKEVAERMTAVPGTKTYGRLSVLCQWLCDVRKVFDLSPAAFTPPPKVTSSVVHFVPKPLPDDALAFSAVESVTAAAFGQRRKMVRSSLKKYDFALEQAGIEPTKRAENLTVEEYMKICSFLP